MSTALNFPPSPTDGEIFGNYRWDETIGVWRLVPQEFPVIPANGYTYVDTVYFTSSGTFAKADYPWLRAIRVRCVGGGGAGGGSTTTGAGEVSMGSGGGSGGYSESFITDISGLDSSITVTRGAGGAGVSGSPGNDGQGSSFGTIVVAPKGVGGFTRAAVAPPALIRPEVPVAAGTGDIVAQGSTGKHGIGVGAGGTQVQAGEGGGSVFGGAASAVANNPGNPGGVAGAGGSGTAREQNSVTDLTGGNGANGIVIVDLYA
jgi:hypothetical protein